MIKVFAFDLDGTLTQHKTPLGADNRAILEKLAKDYTLLMVGAGGCMRILKQLDGFPIDVIGNYGMQYAKWQDGKVQIVRNDVVKSSDTLGIQRQISDLREKYGFTTFVGDSVEFHESGCLTFPILGTLAKIEDKLIFDPDRKKRRAIYSDVCAKFPAYNVFVGGSSSFDMAPKPFNKYYALDLWCKENGYEHSEVIYVGDDYGCGGNDESVYKSDFRFISIDDYTRLGEVLAPWLDKTVTDIDELLGVKSDCPCGNIHSCDIAKVLIRNGALNELPVLTSDFNNVLLVCDENTYRVCGSKVNDLLSNKIDECVTFSGKGYVIPNEEAINNIEKHLTDKTDLVIGVGSGVINDLCKYVSHAHNLPYYIVATAPSMDGYASKGAAMILGGMKVTTNAKVPLAIIADTSIIKEAPIEMLKAGYGDIIGKFSCLNDWRLSNVINGEPVCEYVYNLTFDTVKSVANIASKILSRDEKSIATLMRALIVVGVAMAYMGNSRPASGSEHHLSHYFEVVGLLGEKPYFCHGIDVAYSSYVTANLRQQILSINKPSVKEFNQDEWQKNIRRVYEGKSDFTTAEEIINMQKQLGWIFQNKGDVYEKKWGEIQKVLADHPTPKEVEKMLDDIQLPLQDFENLYGKEKITDAIFYAKYLKDRFTVLWLYDDLFRN